MARPYSGSLRAALWRRRYLLLAIGLIAGLVALADVIRPTPHGTSVVILTAPAAAGTPIPLSSLAVVVSEAVPLGALSTMSEVAGRSPAVALPSGTIVSASLLVGGSLADHAPPHHVVLPVAVADPGSVSLAEPGRTVTLLGPGLTTAGIEALVLAALPPVEGGVFSSGASEVTTLLLAVHKDSTNVVAVASADAPLRVALDPGIQQDP